MTGDEPFCDDCGHLETDHPRGGRCGAAIATRCWCQRFTRAPERRGMKTDVLKQKAVGHARWLARQYGARGVVVLVFDEDRVAGASYGETKAECKKLGQVLDGIVDELQLEGPTAWVP